MNKVLYELYHREYESGKNEIYHVFYQNFSTSYNIPRTQLSVDFKLITLAKIWYVNQNQF